MSTLRAGRYALQLNTFMAQEVRRARGPPIEGTNRSQTNTGKAVFSQVSVTTLEKTSAAPPPRHPAVAYCQGTPLRNEIETRDASLLDHVTDQAIETIAARFGNQTNPGGPLAAGLEDRRPMLRSLLSTPFAM